MPRHTLVMTYNATTNPQSFHLGPGDDIDTGTMSDCVSVVVLFQKVETHYTRAVGQHGGGGIGNVNLTGILNLVPGPGRESMEVFIITGHNAITEDYNSSGNRAVRAFREQLKTAGFRIIKTSHGWSGAIISDTGQCTKYV